MPTKRTWSFLLIALILYLLANQTQVGWIYVLVAGILGLLGLTFWYDRKRLAKVEAYRTFANIQPPEADEDRSSGQSPTAPGNTHSSSSGQSPTAPGNTHSSSSGQSLTAPGNTHSSSSGRSLTVPGNTHSSSSGRSLTAPDGGAITDLIVPDFHEDDPIAVTLKFHNQSLAPAFLISGQETCPFAPAEDQRQPLFIPDLFKNTPVTLTYHTHCDRRGLYTYSKLPLRSAGLFGFFQRRHQLVVPGDLLIYPQFYPLTRLKPLEKLQAGYRETHKVGLGSQVIGTRDYRPGDSLRQVHWRSTARRGNVVVKEFSDEDQLTLTVALDLQAPGYGDQGKFSPFESAIRLAASVGYYARQNNIPFHLLGASPKWRLPPSPLSWSATLNYLAKVQNDGQTPFTKLLESIPPSPFLVLLISQPSATLTAKLTALVQKHSHTLAIVITPEGTLPDERQIVPTHRLTIRYVAATRWQEGLMEL